jgi:hypothetical protein
VRCESRRAMRHGEPARTPAIRHARGAPSQNRASVSRVPHMSSATISAACRRELHARCGRMLGSFRTPKTPSKKRCCRPGKASAFRGRRFASHLALPGSPPTSASTRVGRRVDGRPTSGTSPTLSRPSQRSRSPRCLGRRDPRRALQGLCESDAPDGALHTTHWVVGPTLRRSGLCSVEWTLKA